jgi:hypothetical protein
MLTPENVAVFFSIQGIESGMGTMRTLSSLPGRRKRGSERGSLPGPSFTTGQYVQNGFDRKGRDVPEGSPLLGM